MHIFLVIIAFLGIWIGSGLAVHSVQKLSTRLKISSFMVSFVMLGMFTSIGEFSVGVNSILENDPEIFIGTLIGASLVIFLLIIPMLAIVGKSIKISPEFQGYNLPASLTVIGLPAILVIDGRIERYDAILILSIFFLMLFSLHVNRGVLEQLRSFAPKAKIAFSKEILKILFGITIIFLASHYVVEQTLYFSKFFNISPFLISLLVIAIGTNIPELSLVARSVFMKNTQVAFGDYIGSAVFNTFLFGLLAILYGRPIILDNSYVVSLVFLVFGLLLFFLFARSKNILSRSEGLILLSLYAAFLTSEYISYLN